LTLSKLVNNTLDKYVKHPLDAGYLCPESRLQSRSKLNFTGWSFQKLSSLASKALTVMPLPHPLVRSSKVSQLWL